MSPQEILEFEERERKRRERERRERERRERQSNLAKQLLPGELALRRVVSLEEAADIAGVSIDTLRRRHRNKIRTLSPRRQGMTIGDALEIEAPEVLADPD
ncbi:MAG TPA: hypothetical protein VF913_06660 [Xanthobacteraceae bacterium]